MIHLDDSPVAPENRKSQAQLLYLKRSTYVQHFSSFWCVPSVKAKLKMLYMYS